jgi:predicted kinase
MTLYLIRGLPGSGKSTLAKRLSSEVVEADMFFLVNGIYQFDASRIKDAHNWCQVTTRELLAQGKDVAVANTFTRRWELAPYYEMPAHIFEITVVHNLTDEELVACSVHGVPRETVTAMRERWEA